MPLPGLWLRPRGDPNPQQPAPGPAMSGPAGRHGRRPGPPLLGAARAVGGLRLWHGRAEATRWPAHVGVRLVQGALLPPTVLPLAERGDTRPDCRPMLPEVEGAPRDKGRLARPAPGHQPRLDGLPRAAHHAVAHADQPLAPHGL